MAHDDHDRALRDVDWGELYERQAERGAFVDPVCDLLGLESGDAVLEIGAGPGYVSARLAERVAPGVVYALDRQRDALRYLREESGEPVEGVRPVVGDVGALPVRFAAPTPALASFVLHHVRDPERAIAEVAAALPAGSPFLVAEFHLDSPKGPPEDHRIPPEQVREWLSDAGFTVETIADLSEAWYAVLARR